VRRRGSHEVVNLRQHGDKALSSVLADALGQSGTVERGTHGFHAYPASIHPDAVALIMELAPGHVHDPFCGGGTVLVEALYRGRSCSGTDVSPVALLIARARTASAELATPMRSAARRLAARGRAPGRVHVPEALEGWYEPHVGEELARILEGIQEEDEPVQTLLRAVFSSILVKVSFRSSETSRTQVKHHRPPGTTSILFHKKARELGSMLESVPVPGGAELLHADATRRESPVPAGLIVTSPPYPGVYDYLPMQELRLGWLDLEVGEGFSSEVGSRRSFRADRRTAVGEWRRSTVDWIGRQARGLAAGGRMVMVVGDGLVGGKTVDSLEPTIEGIEKAGLELEARATADRRDHARSRIRGEHAVLAVKPLGRPTR